MLDELVNVVSEKTGLPKEQAKQAAEAVLAFLKERLPAPIAAQLDGVMNTPGMGGDIIKGLDGLFGR
jgi:hypothetical protein